MSRNLIDLELENLIDVTPRERRVSRNPSIGEGTAEGTSHASREACE